MPNTHPPRGAGKAAGLTAAVVAAMIVAIFVGFNLNHSQTLDEQKAGHTEQRDAPQTQTQTDLSRVPAGDTGGGTSAPVQPRGNLSAMRRGHA
ncbi:hypothetical protein ACLBXM_06750 [Xanthobacteraceae bacterium A53D]